jgi:hypothetical protein
VVVVVVVVVGAWGQGANWVVGPPSAAVQELAPLAVLSFLVSSRHTRRSALPPGYRGGSWWRITACSREIAINPFAAATFSGGRGVCGGW